MSEEASRTPISITEEKIVRAEAEAKRMLKVLETTLVRCGYTRDGRYQERVRRGPWHTVLWHQRQIKMSRGVDKDPVTVDEMTTRDLIWIAHHLSGFLDALEEGSRWTLHELEDALEKLREFVERIEADPQPASGDA